MKVRRLGQAVLAIGLTLAVAAPARADEHWIRLPTAPYTLNNKQDAIAFADALTGWYGNGTGRIYRTDDGGEAWTAIWTKQGTYVRALEFADAQTGFLGNIGPGYFPGVTDRQPLYVSHDGGVHWTAVRPVAGRQIVGVCAIDVLKVDGKVLAVRAGGRVGGPAGLLESFDEGRSFRARDMSAVTGMILDIHFVDAEHRLYRRRQRGRRGQGPCADPEDHAMAENPGARCSTATAPATSTGNWLFRARRSATPPSSRIRRRRAKPAAMW